MTYLRPLISSSYHTIHVSCFPGIKFFFLDISLFWRTFPFWLNTKEHCSKMFLIFYEFLIWNSYAKVLNLPVHCSGSQVRLWSNLWSVWIFRGSGNQENTARHLFPSRFIHNWILNVLNVIMCLWFFKGDCVTHIKEILKEDMYLLL